MPDEFSARAEHARSAPSADLQSLIHESDEETLLALLKIRQIEEPHISQMLERLDLSANVLTAIAEKGKWTASEGVRLRLARHPPHATPLRDGPAPPTLPVRPGAPQPVAVNACRNPSRRGRMMITRVPQIPIGQKLTLARRGPARVVARAPGRRPSASHQARASQRVPHREPDLESLIDAGRSRTGSAAIAQHPRWAVQYNVRVALVRNQHTPIPVILASLPNLTLRDLKDLATLEGLSPHVRRYIQKELSRRSGAK